MDLVSVIIPTYNRFNYIHNAIKSIKNQSYKNIDIIVVNDASSQQEYYSYDWSGVTVIHSPINTKTLFGHGCAAFVRNLGIVKAKGKYIAFCDDDDIWLPDKLEKQISAMKQSNCKLCSTEGYVGNGLYDENKKYPLHLSEYFYDPLAAAFRYHGCDRLDNGIPSIIDIELLKIRNLLICSSVVIEKEILAKVGNMTCIRAGEDYDTWLKAMQYTNCVFIKEPCIYYDLGHGDGQNY